MATSDAQPNEPASTSWLRRAFAGVSIRWIMPALLVLPVLVVAVVLIMLAYVTGKRDADDLTRQNTRQLHRQIEEHLTRLLDMPPAMNELNKRMLATGELSLEDVDRNRVPVFEVLNIFDDVSSIVIGKATGQTMWVIRYPGETTYEYAIKAAPDANMEEYTLDDHGQIASERLSSFDFHPTRRPWYIAAIEADGPTWGNVYVWVRNGRGETLGVSYVEPYRDEAGAILGVINTELTLSDISAYLKRLPVGKTGKAFIIERDGNLVATSVDAAVMKQDVNRMPALESEDAWIAQATRELVRHIGSLDGVTADWMMEMTIAGQPMQVAVSPYSNRRNLEWLIVTLVPTDDFLAAVKSNRRHGMVVALLAVLATLLVGLVLARFMVRPILDLVGHVRAVGEGRLEERIDLKDSLEMVQLSGAINQMVHGLQDRMRLRHALSLAMEVQQSLLPSRTPKVRGVDIAAHSKYCDETGGDYYDYLEAAGLGENTLLFALGDVTGHGIAAAMLMATARGILRSHVRTRGSISHLLTHVNDLLVADTDGRRFMTMLLGVMDTSSRTLRWSTAGHDPPFIYDPASDSFINPGDEGGMPLGIAAGEQYPEAVLENLQPGQVIVVGTDGLWESKNTANEEFGRERLKQAIRELAPRDAQTISKALFERLLGFCGARPIDDDVTYVVLKLTEEMKGG